MKEAEPIQINFQITDIYNKCLLHLKKTTEIITLINHTLQSYNDLNFPPLEVDALPISIDDSESIGCKDTPKVQASDWLFKKAFEEFIVGLMESLMEAHKACKLYSLLAETQQRQVQRSEIMEKLEIINTKPTTLSFPSLISEIENELNCKLLLREEVLSINQVRNCLVHGNSVVRKKDINSRTNQTLTLQYIELVVVANKNGELKEIKKEDKKHIIYTDRLDIYTRNKSIAFKCDENVKIDATVFNNISVTCILFIEKLFAKIPLTAPAPNPD